MHDIELNLSFKHRVQLRTVFFWVTTQRGVVFFLPTFREKNDFGFLTPEDGTEMLSRNVGKRLPPLAA